MGKATTGSARDPQLWLPQVRGVERCLAARLTTALKEHFVRAPPRARRHYLRTPWKQAKPCCTLGLIKLNPLPRPSAHPLPEKKGGRVLELQRLGGHNGNTWTDFGGILQASLWSERGAVEAQGADTAEPVVSSNTLSS